MCYFCYTKSNKKGRLSACFTDRSPSCNVTLKLHFAGMLTQSLQCINKKKQKKQKKTCALQKHNFYRIVPVGNLHRCLHSKYLRRGNRTLNGITNHIPLCDLFKWTRSHFAIEFVHQIQSTLIKCNLISSNLLLKQQKILMEACMYLICKVSRNKTL